MRLWYFLPVAAAAFLPFQAQAQTLKSDEVYSSIAIQPTANPNPVLGADNRVHLAFEIVVTNPSKVFVTLEKVEAIDPEGHSHWALEGDDLTAMVQRYGATGRTLPPGAIATVFVDASFDQADAVPPTLTARVTASRQAAGADGKPVPLPAEAPIPAHFTFDGAATSVAGPAIVVEPPLRGKGWVAVNGCCDSITSHRGGVMSINGRLRVPERFAIDWVKLDDAGLLFTGDGSKLESYAYYGTPIHAAADGVVVNLYDGAEEQVPGSDPKGITPENIAGNMVVIDMGQGAYALYAHMQKGSLKVKLGDRVKAGDVIGLLGNTGNTTAPHLHFHVVDGPSPLDANGLPFVFSYFSSPGTLAPGSDDAIQDGKAAAIEPRLAGSHANQLPLNNQVVDFD